MASKISVTVAKDTTLWDKLKKKLETFVPPDRGVKIGVFESAGPHGDDEEITTVDVAVIHEFGSPAAGIPERSFLRGAFRGKKSDINAICKKVTKAFIAGKIDEDQAMAILGMWGVKVVRNYITAGEGVPPPLKPATIAAKGSSRALVDTGKLINSVTYQVIGLKETGPAGGGDDDGGSLPEVESNED